MPGMGGSLNVSNSLIVTSFQHTLLHQFLIVLGILVVVSVSWNILRTVQLRNAITAQPAGAATTQTQALPGEPVARRVLRIVFGLLWILDGILQAQSAMPVGLATQVIQPLGNASSGFVRHLVTSGALIWNNHPIQASVSVVWIELGLGIWLLIAPRGRWLQAGAVASVGWALVVWSFGEGFGGIFAPGLSWCFGAPGAALFYALAGVLIALPERRWATAMLGRRLLTLLGLFFLGMALLQAWPGRGFWQGRIAGGHVGAIASMTRVMSETSQPAFLSGWTRAFSDLATAHGFALNMAIVIALAATGTGLLVSRAVLLRATVVFALVFSFANWLLIQDLGFFGGLGTDPNSMIPLIAVLVASYLATSRLPATVAELPEPGSLRSWILALKTSPTYAFRTIAVSSAALITLLGAAPMFFASLDANADPIVTEALNGPPSTTDTVAPSFSLSDQFGKTVTLASLSGKVVAMTFLDPVCTNDCPLIGQEFAEADRALGTAAAKTVFIAVVANPIYRSNFYTNAFDRQEGLNTLSNWHFLTGSRTALQQVWNSYGVEVINSTAGSMVGHSDIAYVLDGNGHTREILNATPGRGTASMRSSFAGLLDQEIRTLLPTALLPTAR